MSAWPGSGSVAGIWPPRFGPPIWPPRFRPLDLALRVVAAWPSSGTVAGIWPPGFGPPGFERNTKVRRWRDHLRQWEEHCWTTSLFSSSLYSLDEEWMDPDDVEASKMTTETLQSPQSRHIHLSLWAHLLLQHWKSIELQNSTTDTRAKPLESTMSGQRTNLLKEQFRSEKEAKSIREYREFVKEDVSRVFVSCNDWLRICRG